MRLKAAGVVTWRLVGQADSPPEESTLIDLCLIGFSFVSNKAMETEDMLTFELNPRGAQCPPLRGEATVVWSARSRECGGDLLVGAQFSKADSSEVLALILEAYPNNPDVHSSLCAQVQFCSDTEKQRCPAYQEGKNCWEFEELQCCQRPRSECRNCPYASLAFIV